MSSSAVFAPSPVLSLLRDAAALLETADTRRAANRLVDELENDFAAAAARRPAQLVRAAGARSHHLTDLVRAAGFSDLDAVRAQAGRENGSARRARRTVSPDRSGADRLDVAAAARRESTVLADTIADAHASGTLELAAGAVLGSRRRWVFGDLRSRGFAQLFSTDLSAALGQVMLVDPTASGVLTAVADVQRADCLIVFTFRPYSRLAVRLTRHFTERGATVVAITDDAGGPVTDAAQHVLRVVAHGGESSSAAAVMLAGTLAELAASGAKGAGRRAATGRAVAAELDWYET